MYTVYVLKSQKEKWYYVGLTKDLKQRVNEHNMGRVRSTKNRKPYDLVYSKDFRTRYEARDFEKYVKVRSNKEKLLRELSLL